jgi:nicotinamidase-related amidase
MTDALIIIDLQEGPFGGGPAKHDAAGLVSRLNALATTVRTSGGTVVYVQHDGPPGSDHHPIPSSTHRSTPSSRPVASNG